MIKTGKKYRDWHTGEICTVWAKRLMHNGTDFKSECLVMFAPDLIEWIDYGRLEEVGK